jgi:O-antigen ligase
VQASSRTRRLTDISLPFLIANGLLTLAVCLLVNWKGDIAGGVLSLLVLLFLALWRIEFALAVLTSGLFLLSEGWQSLGLQGLMLPMVSVFIVLGYFVYTYRFGLRIGRGYLPVAVLLLGVLMTISLAYTPALAVGTRRVLEYVLTNLVVFAVLVFNRKEQSLSRLLWAFVAIGLTTTMISLGDILFSHNLSGDRYSLLGVNPIWFARSIGLGIIPLLALTSDLRKPGFHLFKWLLVGASLYIIVLAASRGPLLSTILTICVYLYWVPGKRMRHFRIAPPLIFITLLLFIYVIMPRPETTSRLSVVSDSVRDVSTLHRVTAYANAALLFVEHPIAGVGVGGFSHFDFLEYPHNIFLEAASEYGLIGLALIVSIIVAVIRCYHYVKRKLLERPSEMRILRAFTLILIFAFMNAMVSGSITGNSWIWLAMGGIWALKVRTDSYDTSGETAPQG